MKIVIAGAGIGGLTAAMCLKRAGFDVEVFEAVSELRPLGVGINIQAGAVRILSNLGMEPALAATGIETRELRYANRHGQTIWADPRGRHAGLPSPQFSIHLQLAAMDRELRPRQAGMAAARIGPDRLAVAVGIAQLARLDAGRGQCRLHAEARQDAHGARLDVDADAQRPKLAHGFEDVDIEARALEAHRGGEAADARAGNDDLHGLTSWSQGSRLWPLNSNAA